MLTSVAVILVVGLYSNRRRNKSSMSSLAAVNISFNGIAGHGLNLTYPGSLRISCKNIFYYLQK